MINTPEADALILLQSILRMVADRPDDLSVWSSRSDSLITLHIEASSDQMGVLIGHGGRTIRSLQLVMRARGVILKQEIDVHLVERLA